MIGFKNILFLICLESEKIKFIFTYLMPTYISWIQIGMFSAEQIVAQSFDINGIAVCVPLILEVNLDLMNIFLRSSALGLLAILNSIDYCNGRRLKFRSNINWDGWE